MYKKRRSYRLKKKHKEITVSPQDTLRVPNTKNVKNFKNII